MEPIKGDRHDLRYRHHRDRPRSPSPPPSARTRPSSARRPSVASSTAAKSGIADDAIDAVSEAFRILAEGVAPDGFQLADERESLLWGFVNMPRRPGSPPRPQRRPAQPGTARPPVAPRTAPRSSPANWSWSPTGRGTLATAATPSRRCATPPPRQYRDRDRRHMAAPVRQPRQPDRQADLGGDRRPRLPSAPARTARPWRTCRRARWSPSPAARTSPTRPR